MRLAGAQASRLDEDVGVQDPVADVGDGQLHVIGHAVVVKGACLQGRGGGLDPESP